MDLGDLNKVWEVRPLKRRPNEPAAREFLNRVARHVQLIMRRRQWRVKLLSEFCHPKLLGLNINRGAEIRLRLRRHGREDEFLSFEEVLDTMLHELCHMERRPHDAQFYRLWDELRREYEDLWAKGLITDSKEGFHGHGRRLGGFSRHPLPPSVRQAALRAAEKRAVNGTILPSGPRRVGGDNEIMSALSPVQAAAMAAERRLFDDMWCGSCGLQESIDVSECSNDGPNLPVVPEGSDSDVELLSFAGEDSTVSKRPRTANSSAQDIASTSFLETNVDNSSYWATDADDYPWECLACTLLNKPLAPVCEACELPRVKDPSIKSKLWWCKFCTLENSVNDDKCSACNQWRYSFGPPVATRGPNVGT